MLTAPSTHWNLISFSSDNDDTVTALSTRDNAKNLPQVSNTGHASIDMNNGPSASDQDGDVNDCRHDQLVKSMLDLLEKKNMPSKNQTIGNKLTHLIPGYMTPMQT